MALLRALFQLPKFLHFTFANICAFSSFACPQCVCVCVCWKLFRPYPFKSRCWSTRAQQLPALRTLAHETARMLMMLKKELGCRWSLLAAYYFLRRKAGLTIKIRTYTVCMVHLLVVPPFVESITTHTAQTVLVFIFANLETGEWRRLRWIICSWDKVTCAYASTCIGISCALDMPLLKMFICEYW